MQQIALPLKARGQGPASIVVGDGNVHVADALAASDRWPFRTAVLTGPLRSGKSLFARWFAQSGQGEAIDDAQEWDEADLFHRWNRAQEQGTSLLIIGGVPPWRITLPDLASRLGAALQLDIQEPDDDMARDLIDSLAAERGLALGTGAADYLAARCNRSYIGLEKLVETIDRLSLERKAPPTLGVWRSALEAVNGPEEPRLL